MFLPVGNSTSVQLTSNCATPSFQGNFLPNERTVSDSGFTSTWKVLALNRDYGQSVTQWVDYGDGGSHSVSMKKNEFGVMMRVPVLQYQQTTRTVKYAYLFIFLTFATVFFVEYRRQTPIHPLVVPHRHADDHRADHGLLGGHPENPQDRADGGYSASSALRLHVCAAPDGDLRPALRQPRHLCDFGGADVRVAEGEVVQGVIMNAE